MAKFMVWESRPVNGLWRALANGANLTGTGTVHRLIRCNRMAGDAEGQENSSHAWSTQKTGGDQAP